jgi:hypothetical protein
MNIISMHAFTSEVTGTLPFGHAFAAPNSGDRDLQESTVRFRGIEVRTALAIAEQVNIRTTEAE